MPLPAFSLRHSEPQAKNPHIKEHCATVTLGSLRYCVPQNDRGKQSHRRTQKQFNYQKLRLFLKRNRRNFDTAGNNSGAERKMHSSESVRLSEECDAPPVHQKKERDTMSSKNNNQLNIPQGREAMDRVKMQAAQEVGVNLQNGYNGHLTSREAGSIGGQMLKNNCLIQTAIFTRHNCIAPGYTQTVQYIASLTP